MPGNPFSTYASFIIALYRYWIILVRDSRSETWLCFSYFVFRFSFHTKQNTVFILYVTLLSQAENAGMEDSVDAWMRFVVLNGCCRILYIYKAYLAAKPNWSHWNRLSWKCLDQVAAQKIKRQWTWNLELLAKADVWVIGTRHAYLTLLSP